MKMSWNRLLSLVLWFIALFHLVIGFGLMFFIGFQKFMVNLYGAKLAWDVKDIYFIRIIGSFAFVLGVLAASAAKNPLRYTPIIFAFIEFFILRDINRHLYSGELYAGFSVTPQTNIFTSVFFGIQALALVFLWWLARKETNNGIGGKTC